jgi:prolyl oligopeptidase
VLFRSPTLLYGYGGFEISLLPAYAAVTGKTWLEKGGVYVSANIRGGGEYGPRWHKAALREKRHCSYDDFIAVAQDLVKRGVTVPAKLGIRGGSNGGLLMANMLVRAPHLFGAIVCQVPLVDMKRYSHLLAGASWVAEYGDPDKAQDWSFLQCYSAQHNIDPASVSSYPPLLVMTSTKDDRVHPYHARALVRRLLDVQQAEEERRGGSPSTGEGVEGSGAPRILYWENMEGGEHELPMSFSLSFSLFLSFSLSLFLFLSSSAICPPSLTSPLSLCPLL